MLGSKAHTFAHVADTVLTDQTFYPWIMSESVLQIFSFGRQATHCCKGWIHPRVILLVRIDHFLGGWLITERVCQAVHACIENINGVLETRSMRNGEITPLIGLFNNDALEFEGGIAKFTAE